MRIVLASASPRRKQLLESLGIDFDVIVSDVDETITDHSNPKIIVKELACKKAKSILEKVNDPAIIIAADTIVVGNSILGKPESEEDAIRMLQSLSGKVHSVMTGMALIDNVNNLKISHCEVTKVFFRNLTMEDINGYIDTGEYADKAGAYAIQGKAALFVKKIEGDYNNVVGLPIYKLGELLRKHFNLHLI